jgi:hypothetical protein
LEKFNPNGVGAYFEYFSKTPHLATPGVKNDISHWQWEMHHFGMRFADFHQPQFTDNSNIIWDGAEKIDLGFMGLGELDIAEKFGVSNEAHNYRVKFFGHDTYACMHIRRGDYLNVASFIVSDESFLRASKQITNLVKNLLVISDTPLSPAMLEGLARLKINCVTAIGGSPHLVHGLMRLSDILICSNSQFSLTAASLRDESLMTLYPTQHDNDPHSYTNIFLGKLREFQIFSRLK